MMISDHRRERLVAGWFAGNRSNLSHASGFSLMASFDEGKWQRDIAMVDPNQDLSLNSFGNHKLTVDQRTISPDRSMPARQARWWAIGFQTLRQFAFSATINLPAGPLRHWMEQQAGLWFAECWRPRSVWRWNDDPGRVETTASSGPLPTIA
jgi:hypothetical protein